jgi:uncharacterized membrane protein YphA (DoxX/SURF4 family)
MKRNPFSDTFDFLMSEYYGRLLNWPIRLLWLLLLASIAIAVYNYYKDPAQRTLQNVWSWAARFFIGAMWWQQTLWKLPPTYTDNPSGVEGGLHYWVGEMVNNAAFGWQSGFVKALIQPNFYFFAAQVYAVEVFIAVSLLLGAFSRLGGLLGAAMALNLWLGLYRASYEWAWAYFFLVLLQATFAVFKSGRSLGLDAILERKRQSQPSRTTVRRVLAWLT